jgi:hypothetical protein
MQDAVVSLQTCVGQCAGMSPIPVVWRCGHSRVTRYAARVIPWIVFALVAVPLVVVGFVATRRRTVAGEHPASEDAHARALTKQEFAEAEAYEAKWREEDNERYHQERLP